MTLLVDKIILITGSTTGIGAAIARECVSQGAKVMLHGRSQARAKALSDELGDSAAYILEDLHEVSAANKLINATVKQFGRIDGLVNNAADLTRSDIDNLDEETFERMMTVNVKLPLFLIQAAVQQFRQQPQKGTIVNIGSLNAYCGETALLTYSMTKGALMTMTRNLGDAFGPEGIRVNQLNVGWTLTENESELKKTHGFPDDWESLIPEEFAPTGKLMHPENIAHHVGFWLSNLSAPSSGQVYEVEQYPVIGRNFINRIQLDSESHQ
ncbi:MAG: short-chain dehydrogenase [Gammaproteobacteria bacterium RIFCSPHIGHO2_12_FULL_41_15]|nr:MAG: short-chain dehydrogenase [Gammaproteobacteria bacterium RIFCSPHIGHO2_12_FULL_41_15]